MEWSFLDTWIVVTGVLSAQSCALLGNYLGLRDTSTAGMMAVAAGALFILAFFLALRHGVVSRVLNRMALSLKILRDDCLGFLYRFQELAPAGAPPARASDLEKAVKAGSALRLVLWDLARKNSSAWRNQKSELSLPLYGKRNRKGALNAAAQKRL
jgi:manganese/zinc/iron transport system permease protein